MVDRETILAEIVRTAEANGGSPLGKRAFENATGIAESDWSGRHWARWSDALREAGFQANTMNARMDADAILASLAQEIARLGRWPTSPELRLRRRDDPKFPSHNTIGRLGPRAVAARLLVEHFASSAEHQDAVQVARKYIGELSAAPSGTDERQTPANESPHGYVYLLRVGRHFKIGRARDFDRRRRQLAIQLPERAQTVHVIATDDPVGIEAYWHIRFAERRLNGEWFALLPEDVRVFKRRKFM